VIPSLDLAVSCRVVRAPDAAHQNGAAAAEPMQAGLFLPSAAQGI
jgi:hypothetical protein